MKKLSLLILSIFLASIMILHAQNKARYFMQSANDVTSSTPYGNNPDKGHFVQADDALIYYEIYGEGDPVVVLHGGGLGCTYEMGQFIDSLATQYQVIAVSTRGHGKSEIGSKPITYEQRANDIYTVIQNVTEKPVIVLGFSDGAYTGYKLASMYPNHVKKLIAIGAGESVPALRKVPVSKVDEVMAIDSTFMTTQLAMMSEPQHLQAYWTDLARFYNQMTASKELFNTLKCPVLLISGELDPNAPLSTVITAYRMIPNANLAIIADAPHQVFITNFPAVWSNIIPFLEK